MRTDRMRRLVISAVLLLAVFPAAAVALPPRPRSERRQDPRGDRHLNIAEPLSMKGYSRKKFPHWIDQGGGCDTRDRVLIRDGRKVKVGDDCRILSGSWRSYYDGLVLKKKSGVDIDHIVPLANAWRSGARRWGRKRRRSFANDLKDSQLIAGAPPRTAPRATRAPRTGSRRGARPGVSTPAGGCR